MYAGYVQQHDSPQHLQYDESAALALVRLLEKDDLQQLLNDDVKLNAVISDLDQVKRLNIEKDTLFVSNKSLAEHNLSLEPKFNRLKREVATLYEDMNREQLILAEDKTRLDSVANVQSLDTTLALLQTAAAETEEKSENLADQFCNNNLPVERFISSYLPLRTQAHTRRIKVEKMTEMVRNTPNHPPQSAAPPTGQWMMGNVSGNVGQFQPGLPYPVSNMSRMPQPFIR